MIKISHQHPTCYNYDDISNEHLTMKVPDGKMRGSCTLCRIRIRDDIKECRVQDEVIAFIR
jgi:hypothetical protein